MAEQRNDPRIPVSIQGRYRNGTGSAKDVIVTDLSTRGCNIYDRFSNLKQEDRITIRIGNVGPLDAVVRWRTAQLVGLQFDSALHESVFDNLRTTISDWLAPTVDMLESAEEQAPPVAPALETLLIHIRQPDRSDFRFALSELELSLPLSSEEELEAIFHHVLNAIYVSSADEQRKGR